MSRLAVVECRRIECAGLPFEPHHAPRQHAASSSANRRLNATSSCAEGNPATTTASRALPTRPDSQPTAFQDMAHRDNRAATADACPTHPPVTACASRERAPISPAQAAPGYQVCKSVPRLLKEGPGRGERVRRIKRLVFTGPAASQKAVQTAPAPPVSYPASSAKSAIARRRPEGPNGGAYKRPSHTVSFEKGPHSAARTHLCPPTLASAWDRPELREPR